MNGKQARRLKRIYTRIPQLGLKDSFREFKRRVVKSHLVAVVVDYQNGYSLLVDRRHHQNPRGKYVF